MVFWNASGNLCAAVAASVLLITTMSADSHQVPSAAPAHTQVVLLGTGNRPADTDRAGPATAVDVNLSIVAALTRNRALMQFRRVRFAGEQMRHPRQELSGIRTWPILASALRRWRLAQPTHPSITRSDKGLIENRTGNSLWFERLGAFAWSWLGVRDDFRNWFVRKAA